MLVYFYSESSLVIFVNFFPISFIISCGLIKNKIPMKYQLCLAVNINILMLQGKQK